MTYSKRNETETKAFFSQALPRLRVRHKYMPERRHSCLISQVFQPANPEPDPHGRGQSPD
jgi:hypothetical protein